MTVDTFESPRTCESPKTSTVTRMATLTPEIPVTVDIFEFRTSSESRKTSTDTRMATVTPAILVTVDTFVSKSPKMMTVTRKREGGSSQTLEKKRRSQTLEKEKPPPLGFCFFPRLRAESLDYPGLGGLAVPDLCVFGLQLFMFSLGTEGSSHREIPSVGGRETLRAVLRGPCIFRSRLTSTSA